jgi:hypothetical protein
MLRVMSHEAPQAEDYSQPILEGEAGSDYERYLNTEGLLALQKGPDEWVHRDELLFQVTHQASELWLKLSASDAEEARRRFPRLAALYLTQDSPDQAPEDPDDGDRE